MKDEFVMVPRELVARIARAGCWPNDANELRRVLAEQHQSEPVALPAYRNSDLRSPTYGHSRGWNACLDEIAKFGPLYAHADPAKVEWLKETAQKYVDRNVDLRDQLASAVADKEAYAQIDSVLRRRVENAELALKVQTQNCDTLRAQLAERDAQAAQHKLAMDAACAEIAERDALLCDILNDITSRGWSGGCAIPSRIESALERKL